MFCQDLDHYDSLDFIQYCRTRNFKMAKRIIEQLGPGVVHSCNDKAFREACRSGEIDRADWLMKESGDLDIHVLDDEPLMQAVQFGRQYMAGWLMTLGTLNDLVLHEAFLVAVMHSRRGDLLKYLRIAMGLEETDHRVPFRLERWACRVSGIWSNYETTHLCRRDFRKRLMVFSGLKLLSEHEREVLEFM